MEKIPKPVIKRLVMYYRCLERLKGEGKEYTSSKELAQRLGIKACQIRKDLSYFGEFGKRGVGYRIDHLHERLKEILGIGQTWKVVIIGAGNLGKAIAGHKPIRQQGFEIVGMFDIDGRKIGRKINGITVMHMNELEDFVRKNGVRIAILCVPPDSAQKAAEAAEKAGVEGILNFTTRVLKVNVPVENVDFSASLKSLTFQIVKRRGRM